MNNRLMSPDHPESPVEPLPPLIIMLFCSILLIAAAVAFIGGRITVSKGVD
jgi:hypothetical protein